jgi:hypothetical protein
MHSPVLRFTDAGPEITYQIRPKPGQMLLFPAWLSHSVEAWEGSGERISIAMNIRRSGRTKKAANITDRAASRSPAENPLI